MPWKSLLTPLPVGEPLPQLVELGQQPARLGQRAPRDAHLVARRGPGRRRPGRRAPAGWPRRGPPTGSASSASACNRVPAGRSTRPRRRRAGSAPPAVARRAVPRRAARRRAPRRTSTPASASRSSSLAGRGQFAAAGADRLGGRQVGRRRQPPQRLGAGPVAGYAGRCRAARRTPRRSAAAATSRRERVGDAAPVAVGPLPQPVADVAGRQPDAVDRRTWRTRSPPSPAARPGRAEVPLGLLQLAAQPVDLAAARRAGPGWRPGRRVPGRPVGAARAGRWCGRAPPGRAAGSPRAGRRAAPAAGPPSGRRRAPACRAPSGGRSGCGWCASCRCRAAPARRRCGAGRAGGRWTPAPRWWAAA